MINLSAQSSRLTFTTSGLGSVTFADVGDMGAPIEFGEISPISTEYDLNYNLVVSHHPVTPMFSVSFIPGSPSDRQMRAFLLSSVSTQSKNRKGVPSPSDIVIEECTWGIDDETAVFSEGYLVGGASGLSVSSDGRYTSRPYRFVFRDVTVMNSTAIHGISRKSGVKYRETGLKRNGKVSNWMYYSQVTPTSSARMISHPIETGALIFDQKYMEPQKITLRAKVPLSAVKVVEAGLDKVLRDRSLSTTSANKTPYSVVTKAAEYKNLSLINYTHNEIPDRFDMVDYTMVFQELMFSSVNGYTETLDAANQDAAPTQALGTQSTRPST